MTEAPRDFRPRALYIAFVLMAVGTTIYAAFRIVQSAWLVMAGMAWIPIGCLFVLVGLIDLRRSPPPRWKPYLLLFANFPVAILCTMSAVDVMTRAEVYVRNESGESLTDVRLELRLGPERVIPLGNLEPGDRVARAIRGLDSGELWVSYTSAGARHEIVLHGYVASGDFADAVIGPGGTATVDNDRPTFLWPVLP